MVLTAGNAFWRASRIMPTTSVNACTCVSAEVMGLAFPRPDVFFFLAIRQSFSPSGVWSPRILFPFQRPSMRIKLPFYLRIRVSLLARTSTNVKSKGKSSARAPRFTTKNCITDYRINYPIISNSVFFKTSEFPC